MSASSGCDCGSNHTPVTPQPAQADETVKVKPKKETQREYLARVRDQALAHLKGDACFWGRACRNAWFTAFPWGRPQ